MIDAISPEKRLCERQLNQKRQVKLRTCADVYDKWRAYKPKYKKAPKEGVEFQIDYIDTGLGMSGEQRAQAPVALALHGAPGSYHDFSLLINHLAGQKVRVIAPNFPEYAATVKTKVLFRHSADEKAAYLRDFLKSIEVDRIELLVSHSSAIFPTLLILLNEQQIQIKSVALFNPAGHRLPKSMKPTWFKCGAVHVYQHKIGRSLFRKFGPGFLTIVGVPVRVDNMDNVMLSATVMRNGKCRRVAHQLEQLSELKIPTLLVFSENDKLIEKEIFYEMTQFMKLDSANFDVFNNDGDIELAQSKSDDWIRVMVFKAGGHYAYSNYAKTVNKAVSELLARVTPVMGELAVSNHEHATAK